MIYVSPSLVAISVTLSVLTFALAWCVQRAIRAGVHRSWEFVWILMTCWTDIVDHVVLEEVRAGVRCNAAGSRKSLLCNKKGQCNGTTRI